MYQRANAIVVKMQWLKVKVTQGRGPWGLEGEPLDVESVQHGDWKCGRNSPAIYLSLDIYSWGTEQKSFLKERRGQWTRLSGKLFFRPYRSSHFLVNIYTWTSYRVSNPRCLKATPLAPTSNRLFFWTSLDKVIFFPVTQTQDPLVLPSQFLSHPHSPLHFFLGR